MEAFSIQSYQTGRILRDDTTYTIHDFVALYLDENEKCWTNMHCSYLCEYVKRIELFLSKLASMRTSYEMEVLKKLKDYIGKNL